MIKVDYISTRDINRVAKIHSNKKYYNWIMKIVDNEYRFYPPIVIEDDDEYDDFDFNTEEDNFEFDGLFETENLKFNLPMFGELWENTTKFFKEEKFKFVNILESNLEKKMHTIKKGMNSLAKVEKYTCGNNFYKLYRVRQNNSCESKMKRYGGALMESYKITTNMSSRIKKEKANEDLIRGISKNLTTVIKKKQYEKELTLATLQKILKKEKCQKKEKDIFQIITKYNTSKVNKPSHVIEESITKLISECNTFKNIKLDYSYKTSNYSRKQELELIRLAKNNCYYKNIFFGAVNFDIGCSDYELKQKEQDIMNLVKECKNIDSIQNTRLKNYEISIINMAKEFKDIKEIPDIKVSKNMAFVARISKFLQQKKEEIEILSFDEEYA